MYEQKTDYYYFFFILFISKNCNNYYKNDVSKEPQNNFKKVTCMFVKHYYYTIFHVICNITLNII